LVVLARRWLDEKSKKFGGQVLTVVLLRPRTTAAVGVAVIVAALVVVWTGRVVGEYRERRHNEWRLQQMTDAVRQADQRVRSRIVPSNENVDGEFRGVFETMREPTDPTRTTEVPQVSESKP
jgi:hypothetical protein